MAATTLLAVDGMTLVPDDPLVICTITPIGVPSVKVSAGGKGVIKDGFNVQVTAITYPSAGATIPDPGPYTVPLNSSATKVSAEGSNICLEGDLSDAISTTTLPQVPGSPPVSYPVSFKIKIQVAGQTKVKGN